MLKRILNLEGTQKLSKKEQKNITGAGAPGAPTCDPPGSPIVRIPIKCPANNIYGFVWTCEAFCQ
ncbi:hypothetical protein [Flavobacterium aestivum]|uniref:hypothetical protein n=1 Tax=Flavobacterium aestivum TaxID=3003257 RepID=UPI0022860736|nr:hypothetical protein [Flavobacterium aestivum]